MQHGSTIEQALAASRVYLHTGPGPVDWSMPVLYQGSGQAEQRAWYERRADALIARIHEASFGRMLRMVGSVVVLVLLLAGVRRLALGMPQGTVALAAVFPWLMIWCAASLLVPVLA
ncbi:MAG: hypothetical protein HC876_21425, partial [Chloroflexaceae bacterium]|nr:hypothetical protein [Chloroflexaceae bacterium]